MTNAELIAKAVVARGGKGIMVHTLPNRPEWLYAEKISDDRWNLVLLKPESNIRYNIGIVSEKDHIAIANRLILEEVRQRISTFKLAQKMKYFIKSFKRYMLIHNKFLKI